MQDETYILDQDRSDMLRTGRYVESDVTSVIEHFAGTRSAGKFLKPTFF